MSYLQIDLGAIAGNVERLRSATTAELMVAVKADGYGHGLVPAARAALAGGATWLAVAAVEEALQVRAAGIAAPILALIPLPEDRLEEAVRQDVDLSLGGPRVLAAVASAAAAAGRTARIHLEVDTGLSRGGVPMPEAPHLFEAAAKAAAGGAVQVVGVWSHLACADETDNPLTTRQTETYREALEVAGRYGIEPQVRHLANSAGILAWPQTHFDLVRPGIAAYGLPPVPAEGFVPAMTLAAPVALTKRLRAGAGVSYGHTYVADRDTGVALVPLGYGDGVPRHASNRAEVWLAGRRRPIAGRVCMDQFVVTVGDDRIEEGEPVILFGPGTRGEPTAQDWAEATGTISYEIVTRIGARLPRRYLESGRAGEAVAPR